MWNVAVLTAEKQAMLTRVVDHLTADCRLQILGWCQVGRALPEFAGFTRFQGLCDAARSKLGARGFVSL